MPALNDFDLCEVRDKLWPAIVPQRRDMCQGPKDIHLRQRERGVPNALCLGRNRSAQFGKQTALDVDDLLLRIENLSLVFLELRSREALSPNQGLLAVIILRDKMQIRLRNLEVVAKDR